MTTAAVRSVADPRPVRGPVGRRTLQVMLFLGGLLALGVLFGAEAHAEQVPVPSHAVVEKAVARGSDAMADRTAVPDAEPATDATEAADATRVPAVRPEGSRAAERLAVPAAATTATVPPAPSAATDGSDTVPGLRPVSEAARATVQDLGRPVGQLVGTALGQAAGLLPDPLALPTGLLPPRPLIGPPAHGSADGSAPRPAAPGPRPVSAYTVAADPGRGFAALLSGVTAKGAERRGAVPQDRPTPGHVPLDPCGGFGVPATAVTHVPRGGDQHAVPFAGGASFGLVRGAGLPATAAPMRDRSGEIVEFPG